MAQAGQKRQYQGGWETDGKRPKQEGDTGFYGNNQWQQGNQYIQQPGAYSDGNYSDRYNCGGNGWGGPPPPPPQNQDFTDDYSAFCGPSAPQRGGRGGMQRGRGGRGGFRGGQGCGPAHFGPGGMEGPGPRPGFRGGRGGGPRGFRGGMPPFFGRGGRGRGMGDPAMVPPVHSLAKVKPDYPDVENMSFAEKLRRFSLFLQNDESVKINAIQSITNGIMSSKLYLVVNYAADELTKVGGNSMFTGVLTIDEHFIARSIGPNKKQLKQDVFKKAFDRVTTKTVAEILELQDPGIDAVRKEFEEQASVKIAKGLAPSAISKTEVLEKTPSNIVLQDISEALKKVIDTINNMKTMPTSPISVLEQAMNMAHCIIRHQFVVEAIKLPNGRLYYEGKLLFGDVVLGRGHAMTKKHCKKETYKKTLDRLKELPIEELKQDCPEEENKSADFCYPLNHPQNLAARNLPIEERLGGMIKSLDNIPGRESNINPLDIAAMSNGLTPMVIFRVLPSDKEEERFLLGCELYLDKIQISKYEGVKKHDCMVQTYNQAVEVLTSSSIETILLQHKRITDEELKDPHIMDIFIKGSGKMVESNSSGLRRYNCDLSKLADHRIDSLVLIEHKCWARDRARNAFCILQFSCTHNGMLLQWETKTVENMYLCIMTVQKKEVGRSYGTTRVYARNKAATDALFRLYETQPVITMSIVDDSNRWVPFETIKEDADKMREDNVGEEPIMKSDEKGNPLPDSFIIKAIKNKLQEFNDSGRKMEFTIGPGIGLVEYRHLRTLAKEMDLKFDGRQHNGEPYPAFFERRTWPEIVEVLKENNGVYGKFVMLTKEDLPKHADIEDLITLELPVETEDKIVAEVEMKEEKKD